MKSVVFALSFLTILSACQARLEGVGEPVEESRVLENFEVLRLDCPADIRLHAQRAGESPKVIVRVEENLLPFILTTVDDPKLIIDFKEEFVSPAGVTIDVYNSSLIKIINAGSGSITADEVYKGDDLLIENTGSGDIHVSVKCDDLRAKNEGSGDVTLEGKCERARYRLYGSGDLHARNLKTPEANAQNSGSGTLSMYAKKEIKASVEGSGDIKYIFKGSDDDKDLELDGSGQLIELGE